MVDSVRASEVRKKLESFKAFVKWGFSDFSESFNIGSAAMPDAWEFCVKNQIGISVYVRYSEFRNRANVLASIAKQEESEGLRVVEWLKREGRMEEAAKFLIEDFQREGVVRIYAVLDYLDNLFCSDLSDVLAGKRWKETPFDWAGMR